MTAGVYQVDALGHTRCVYDIRSILIGHTRVYDFAACIEEYHRSPLFEALGNDRTILALEAYSIGKVGLDARSLNSDNVRAHFSATRVDGGYLVLIVVAEVIFLVEVLSRLQRAFVE